MNIQTRSYLRYSVASLVAVVLLLACQTETHAQGRRTTGGDMLEGDILSVTTCDVPDVLVRGNSYLVNFDVTWMFFDNGSIENFFLLVDSCPKLYYAYPAQIISQSPGHAVTPPYYGSMAVNNLSLPVGEHTLYMYNNYGNFTTGKKITVVSPVAVPATDPENTLNPYPNPATDKINISAATSITNVSVCNLLGQQVYARSFHADKAEIDIKALPAGTYIAAITLNNGVIFRRFIKGE